MKSYHVYWFIANLWLIFAFFALLMQSTFLSLDVAGPGLIAGTLFFALNLCLAIRAHAKEYR